MTEHITDIAGYASIWEITKKTSFGIGHSRISPMTECNFFDVNVAPSAGLEFVGDTNLVTPEVWPASEDYVVIWGGPASVLDVKGICCPEGQRFFSHAAVHLKLAQLYIGYGEAGHFTGPGLALCKHFLYYTEGEQIAYRRLASCSFGGRRSSEAVGEETPRVGSLALASAASAKHAVRRRLSARSRHGRRRSV